MRRLAAATLLGLVSLAAAPAPSGADAPAAAPRLVVEPATFDFGAVKAGRVVQKEFLVRNTGTADLVIASVVSSCGCAAVVTEATTLKPGARTPLRVRLTAPQTVGPLRKSVILKSNDPERPALEVKLQAAVVEPRTGGR